MKTLESFCLIRDIINLVSIRKLKKKYFASILNILVRQITRKASIVGNDQFQNEGVTLNDPRLD